MRNNVWKILVLMLTGILASTSCKENSYDYEYRIVNDQSCDVLLKFTLDINDVSFEDVIRPHTDTLIYLRKDVTGNEIWDVESALQIYPFKSIVAYRLKSNDNEDDVDTSKNLKLRRMWEGVKEITRYGEDRGVYTLHLVDSVFKVSVVPPGTIPDDDSDDDDSDDDEVSDDDDDDEESDNEDDEESDDEDDDEESDDEDDEESDDEDDDEESDNEDDEESDDEDDDEESDNEESDDEDSEDSDEKEDEDSNEE